jgi:sulfide:quinone oxidoreductase
MGDIGAVFVAFPQILLRNRYLKGKWVHFAKIAFEKYFLYKISYGSTSLVDEKYRLKVLGIVPLVEQKTKKYDE